MDPFWHALYNRMIHKFHSCPTPKGPSVILNKMSVGSFENSLVSLLFFFLKHLCSSPSTLTPLPQNKLHWSNAFIFNCKVDIFAIMKFKYVFSFENLKNEQLIFAFGYVNFVWWDISLRVEENSLSFSLILCIFCFFVCLFLEEVHKGRGHLILRKNSVLQH